MSTSDELVRAELEDELCIDISASSRTVWHVIDDGPPAGPDRHTAALTVRDVMTASPVTVPVGTRAKDIALLLATHTIGAVVVCDQRYRPVGMITDRDLMVEILARDRSPDTSAADIIHHRPIATVHADDCVNVAVEIMRTRAVRRVPVIGDGGVVGIVSLADIARHVGSGAAGVLVQALSSSPDNSAEG